MKKTEILNQSCNTSEIDWSIPMWVIAKDNMIVLTNGKHIETSFSGTCLPCKSFEMGQYSDFGAKSMFKPIKGSLTINIGN